MIICLFYQQDFYKKSIQIEIAQKSSTKFMTCT
uniref:Uncharacterized protein n=1 Tax=Anguilla anguilla TaxID=7936 RepID=A0A0E9VB82_ANGAN